MQTGDDGALFEQLDASGQGGGSTDSDALTVSALSQALKRVVEGRFQKVRVRGELGRVTHHRAGHIYLSLKDQNAVIDGVIWKGRSARLAVRPEEGMEVIATGKLTTFPGASKYQLVVERLEAAGVGALMAQLEARKRALSAEGLFDEDRKRPLPRVPRVIGVLTSPTGAVIRDILHRLSERFPRHVLVWPVAVQGPNCAPEVTAAIRGFNALSADGSIPRPDLLIVARGGGSIEDLWGFNDEAVVRAVAASDIPVISAVGHETDVTLVDHAADLRAPTPTAAAEKAVPNRRDLEALLADRKARLARAAAQKLSLEAERLDRTTRMLPRPEFLVADARQRLDLAAERLPRALSMTTVARTAQLREIRARLNGVSPAARLREARASLVPLGQSLHRAGGQSMRPGQEALSRLSATLSALSYKRVLERGFAVVRGEDGVLRSNSASLTRGDAVSLEMADGAVPAVIGDSDGVHAKSAPVQPKRRKPAPKQDNQGSLFEL